MLQGSSTAPSPAGYSTHSAPAPDSATMNRPVEWACAAALAVALLLVPALWNGFPLLEYDTGGYIARWYDAELVESRSTTFGLFLAATHAFDFWPALLVQAILTVWLITLTLRALDLGGSPWRLLAIVTGLAIATTLPWLTTILLTDVFAGLSVLALFLLICRADVLTRWEKGRLFILIAFSASSHSATFAVLLALLAAAFLFHFWLRQALPWRRIFGGAVAVAVGAGLLLATNFALSHKLAWTPGGYSLPFARTLQDGIVTRYLKDHCPQEPLKLCPYRDKLPATADEFLWDSPIFDDLGRFAGLDDEMRGIFLNSIIAYPWQHLTTALRATLTQLSLVGTGYGVNNALWHTYGVIKDHLPEMLPALKAARQQRGTLGPETFASINQLHRPIALLCLIATVFLLGRGLWQRNCDSLTLLAATVLIAVLANAFVCSVVSGPHDRYGARLAWLPVLVAVIAVLRARKKKAALPADRVADVGRRALF